MGLMWFVVVSAVGAIVLLSIWFAIGMGQVAGAPDLVTLGVEQLPGELRDDMGVLEREGFGPVVACRKDIGKVAIFEALLTDPSRRFDVRLRCGVGTDPARPSRSASVVSWYPHGNFVTSAQVAGRYMATEVVQSCFGGAPVTLIDHHRRAIEGLERFGAVPVTLAPEPVAERQREETHAEIAFVRSGLIARLRGIALMWRSILKIRDHAAPIVKDATLERVARRLAAAS